MIIHADARSLPLRDACVQCCVTSPPYYGLRDYGVDGQIGLEASTDTYVAELVTVFREVRRVLKDDGVLWLNLGDSYSQSSNTGGTASLQGTAKRVGAMNDYKRPMIGKPKDLLGIPWRVAFALQADGWYLRSDIIWSKPNPMPESVTDRPTKAHEYVFLLAKSERYFYDKDSICEPYHADTLKRGKSIRQVAADGFKTYRFNGEPLDPASVERGRNARTVWHLSSQPYRGAHFATMPEKLVEPCILAGSRPGDLVLDPFLGSGTVGAVAERLGRRWVGCDLNPAYHELARKRTAQRGLIYDGDVA